MNNVRKGLEAASRPVVALCDAGIALDAGELAAAAAPSVGQGRAGAGAQGRRAAGELRGRDGMRLHQRPSGALPAGRRPAGHARRVGRRDHPDAGDTLQRIGDWQRLHSTGSPTTIPWCARCATASARRPGWRDVMPRLPLGRRDWPDVWRAPGPLGVDAAATAQVRALVLLEPAIGWLASGLAGASALVACGVGVGIWCLLGSSCTPSRGSPPRRGSWPAAACRSDRAPAAAALVREALVPVLAVQALARPPSIDWRGTDLGGAGVAGARGWRRRKEPYEHDERHGGHRHRHAAGARRFGDLARRSRR